MIETITKGILNALRAEFGDDYTYYKDDIKQGFKRPCFFIAPITLNHKKGFNVRYYQNHLYDIRYHPSTDSLKTEIQAVQERLCWCLEDITDDVGRIRSHNMKAETVDNVGHFIADFNIQLAVIKPKDNMQTLDVESGVKGGD